MSHDPTTHKIEGTNFAYLDHGAYATVFVDRAAGRVRKVFRVQNPHDSNHCANVYAAELGAYRIAQRHPKLALITPTFYGTPSNFRIVGNVSDVTHLYHTAMTLELSFVPGTFEKVGADRSLLHSDTRAVFWDAGIRHLTDMSVTLLDGLPIYIDFALIEFELSHDEPD